jgi:hypothetical protein
MGSGNERAPRGSRILECRRRTTTPYMEGGEGRPSRRQDFPTATGRLQRLQARRQHAICHLLTCLTSRSQAMMEELRNLWCLLDKKASTYERTTPNQLPTHGPTSSAETSTTTTGKHTGKQTLNPKTLFAEINERFGRHSIDRFTSALNTTLPRYNARWSAESSVVMDYIDPTVFA